MNRIRHIEIAGRDGAGLQKFYAALFGWPIKHQDVSGVDYYDVQASGEPTMGIRHEPDGKAEIVIYIDVDDLEAAVEKAVDLGATMRIAPMQYGAVRFALIEDPEGNPVGLTQA